MQYSYDDIGNLTGRADKSGGSFSLGTAISSNYGENGAGPHAITSSTLGSYSYDLKGNQNTGPNRTVIYTAFNLPSRIFDAGHANDLSYQYDAFHQRTVEQSHNATNDQTVLIGELFERRVVGGAATDTFLIPGDSRVVAQVNWLEQAGGQVSRSVEYLHDDRLSSVESVTDSTGVLKQHLKYDPFGARRSPGALGQSAAPVGDVRVGFTGQRQDDPFGLINMRGRMYDPAVGRFLTADPAIQAPLSSQSHNRYSYALNNPLRFTDPSGFDSVDGGGDGLGYGWPDALSTPSFVPYLPSYSGPTGVEGVVVDEGQVVLGEEIVVRAPNVDSNGPSGGIAGTEVAPLTVRGSGSDGTDNWTAGQFADALRTHDPRVAPYQGVHLQEDSYGRDPWKLDYLKSQLEDLQRAAFLVAIISIASGSGPPKPPVPLNAAPAAVAAEGAGGDMVSLYRAVGDSELKVIESSGQIPPSLSGLESKYFSATAEGAASYARQAVLGFGDEPYTLVETQIPRSSLPTDVLWQVDRNVPAVVLPNEYLPQLGPVTVWPYMPVP